MEQIRQFLEQIAGNVDHIIQLAEHNKIEISCLKSYLVRQSKMLESLYEWKKEPLNMEGFMEDDPLPEPTPEPDTRKDDPPLPTPELDTP